jgi:hypothetical protein
MVVATGERFAGAAVFAILGFGGLGFWDFGVWMAFGKANVLRE